MEEGVADAGGGMDGVVEGVADAAPVSASVGHGGEATGGHGGEATDGHGGEAEGVPGAPLDGVHGGEAEGGPGAAPEGGHGGEAEGGPGATASDASAPAWLQGFGAYCSRRDEDKCPWRIYASTMEDGCTVMVRKNSCGHDFSSTKRKKKIKNATKRWICEHVKDWLIEDATLGPKALRKKLKEHHGINIKYKRVYMEDHQRRGQRPPNQLNHQLCLARMMLHQPCVFRQAKSWRKQPRKKGNVVNLDPQEQKGNLW
ncbi:aspartate, glycine, lysine and serine-rich protein-like isoform X2 [Triticum urartu]|uniref:aspartate, glycine, lysine and serine-rich protein-like isoform X2 n=1 Tax=Triticum urartu TaxID=4572 RepID=UPI0020446643|nr:aspartate, glycine, lysine and serine-rich protein-like isoform X2 [Triticum urartu]